MEQKNVLLSALSVGVGVGVGIGLAGKGVTKWGANEYSSSNGVTPENMEREMQRLVVDGRESKVTFDQFPYYLRYFLNLITNLFPSFLLCFLVFIFNASIHIFSYTLELYTILTLVFIRIV